MTIAQAETLKSQLTDKYVIVNEAPELRRFAGLTGFVKTVNMNGRALVQFDGAVDISWYDIDPSCLTVVDAPLPKKKAEHAEKLAAAQEEKPKAKPSAGKSPLEMARAQGAGGKAAPTGEKKLSPLELARQQGAVGAKPEATSEKKLSPLEMARQQGSAKDKSEAATAPVEPVAKAPAPEPEPEVTTPVVVTQTESVKSSGTSASTPGSTAEIIALARQQGPFKR